MKLLICHLSDQPLLKHLSYKVTFSLNQSLGFLQQNLSSFFFQLLVQRIRDIFSKMDKTIEKSDYRLTNLTRAIHESVWSNRLEPIRLGKMENQGFMYLRAVHESA